ncbi:MAG: hypothetical protein ACRDL8_01380, partial [Solirubrobacteraceae bacterium]
SLYPPRGEITATGCRGAHGSPGNADVLQGTRRSSGAVHSIFTPAAAAADWLAAMHTKRDET